MGGSYRYLKFNEKIDGQTTLLKYGKNNIQVHTCKQTYRTKLASYTKSNFTKFKQKIISYLRGQKYGEFSPIPDKVLWLLIFS